MDNNSQFHESRKSLFEKTLEVEKFACENELRYAERYPFSVSIILTISVGSVTALVTTLDYDAISYDLMYWCGIITPFTWICLVVAFLGFVSIVVGSVFGMLVLFTKTTAVIDTEKAKELTDQTNDKIDALIGNASSAEEISALSAEELNEYLHQQIANYADIAQQESKANDKRVLQTKLMLIFNFAGIFIMILCYFLLSIIG